MAQEIPVGIAKKSVLALIGALSVGATRRTLALALLAAAVVLAGCGPAPAPTPSPSPAPSPTAGVTPAPGSVEPAPDVTTLPPGAFTMDLPAGWRSVPVDGDHDALVGSFRSRNTAFADSLESRLASLSDTTTHFAFDASADAVEHAALVTLVVTEVALPLDVSLRTFAVTIQDQVKQLVEADVELRRILISAGEAYSLGYVAPLMRPDGQPAAAAITQVLYVLPGRGYVLTFAAPPDRANDYAREMADIATSFTIRL